MARNRPINTDDDEEAETPAYGSAPHTPPRVARPGLRDKTLVEVLVLAKNAPIGVVQQQARDEYGELRFDAQDQPVLEIVERPLRFKERVLMERWCADIMAGEDREHVSIITATAR